MSKKCERFFFLQWVGIVICSPWAENRKFHQYRSLSSCIFLFYWSTNNYFTRRHYSDNHVFDFIKLYKGSSETRNRSFQPVTRSNCLLVVTVSDSLIFEKIFSINFRVFLEFSKFFSYFFENAF